MNPVDESKKLTLQEMLERDKEKIAENNQLRVGTTVDPEDEMLSEFGLYFGWDAVWAVKTNTVTANDMQSLILGARKVNNANRYNKSIDMYFAFAGSQGKEGNKAFKEHLGNIRKT